MFLDSLRAVRQQHGAIEQAFIRRLSQSYVHYFQPNRIRSSEPAAAPDTLALIEQDLFEERLQVENTVAWSRQEHHALLAGIEARLHMLVSHAAVSGESPLTPRTLADCFHHALGQTSLPSKVKRVVYTLFDQHVMREAGPLYKAIDALFTQAGLKAPQKPAKPPQKPTATQTTHAAFSPAAKSHGSTAVDPSSLSEYARAAQRVSDIRHLIERVRQTSMAQRLPGGSHPLTSAAPTSEPVIGREAIDDLLIHLQQQARTHTAGSISSEHLKQALQRELAVRHRSKGRVADGDAQTIDLVGMLFDYIKADARVPNTFQQALGRLHIPFLRFSLDEPDVFVDPGHPLRRLLDRLALAVDLSAGNEANESRLIDEFRQIDNTLLADALPSPSSIRELTDAVDRFINELEEKARLREQRAVETAKGHDRLASARSRANAVIARLTADHALPSAIEDFLRLTWNDVLVFIQLREGENSESFKAAQRTAQTLARGDTRHIGNTQGHEALMAGIASGLNLLGRFSSTEIAKIQKALGSALSAPMPAATRAAVATPAAASAPPSEASMTPPMDAALEHSLKEHLRVLEHVEYGRYFEFQQDGGKVQLKLSWFSPTTENYMFVDKMGQRVAVKPIRQLAMEMLSGSARLLDKTEQPSLVDRAIHAIHRMLTKMTTRD
ncbi:hypothetical protein GCM10009304_27960 [Pseudomonas matsuisoli]|uniref:DUF1631 domain-containing protein n=2 Tax=Pseudomonas matsuisoli TaxID=1515666 RepID=A0A917UZG1_9PSED|nr:hypothetical protein GCM10009304_27960 [Pseudomonas matsuisoli]